MKTNSIAFRLMAGAAVWIGGALAAAGFVLSAMFGDHIRAGFEQRMAVLLESLVAVSEVDEKGALVLERAPGEPLFDQPFSGWYWQIASGAAPLRRSRSLWDVTLPPGPAVAKAGDAIHFETAGPRDQRLLVLGRDIVLPGARTALRYTVAADLAVLEAERRPFGATLGWSLAVLWLGLTIAVFVQVHVGLRPLGRLRRALADIRTGRSDQLPGGFPREITPLADEFNIHMRHIAEIVERARTHVGNMAHALKTPLSVLGNEAEQADGALAETVRRQTAIMGRRVDHYLVRARTAATGGLIGARSDMAPVLADLARTLERIHRDRGVRVVLADSDAVAFRGDRQDVEESVGNIVDNGCKWAKSQVRARVERDGENLRLIIEDDGPGLPPERRAEALSRGGRLDETVPGTGFGLAIVHEIVGLYGGTMELGESKLGGLRVDVVLPAAEA